MFESWFSTNSRKLRNTLEAGQSYGRKLIQLLKIVLLPATFGFIGYKLLYAYNLNELLEQTRLTGGGKGFMLMFATLLLMVTHWMLEARKWQLLVSKNESTTYAKAFKGVLSGVALNIVTPNQLGDFIGRVIYLEETGKVKGTLITVIGHTAQVIMTAAFGLASFLWLLQGKGLIHQQTYLWLVFFLVILAVLAVICFLHIRVVSRLRVSNRVTEYLSVFRLYSRKELVQILCISLVRYLIFALQYYLLTRFFLVEITVWQCLACITAAMFVQSFVPSFILIELGMRGASALWFFGMFTGQVAPVLLSTYVLWMINVMIPGLTGLFFILKWKAK